MICRAGTAGLLAVIVSLAGAAAAASERRGEPRPYYLARADARLCPSPMCGGIWVALVNRAATTCADDRRRKECYAASADLSPLRGDGDRRIQLQRLITEGRAVARGRLVRGRLTGTGLRTLETFVVTEVWAASSSLGRARGVFHRLSDSGVRCVTTPCYSIRAEVLNTPRSIRVSDVDLTRTGASAGERQRAIGQLSRHGLLAAGRVVSAPDGGHTFVATQFYVKAAPN